MSKGCQRGFGARAYGLAVVGTLGLVQGCASLHKVELESAERAVKPRAEARWQAAVASDYEKIYSFVSPGSRARFRYEDLVRSLKSGFWTGATVLQVTCKTAALCEATVDIRYQSSSGIQGNRVVAETWVQDGGEWYFVVR